MELLQEYNFKFKYEHGADNVVLDALSRQPDHQLPSPVTMNLIELQLNPKIKTQMIESYQNDPKLSTIYKLCQENNPPPRFSVNKDLLYINRKGQTLLCILNNSDLRLT
ncbi:hypothetical protein BGZ76_005482, partial [Entomortierella beljakovae]